MRTPIAQRLRDDTADLHREAERHVRVLDDDATEATYIRFLSRMYGFHAAMERAFAGHAELAAVGFRAADRRKSAMAAQDLCAMGHNINEIADVAHIGGLSRALGAGYVIEGSTLGGAFVLAKMHFRPRSALFLTGYGERTGPMWKQFVQLLDKVDDDDACVAGARATFAELITWLDEPAREAPQPFRGLESRA